MSSNHGAAVFENTVRNTSRNATTTMAPSLVIGHKKNAPVRVKGTAGCARDGEGGREGDRGDYAANGEGWDEYREKDIKEDYKGINGSVTARLAASTTVTAATSSAVRYQSTVGNSGERIERNDRKWRELRDGGDDADRDGDGVSGILGREDRREGERGERGGNGEKGEIREGEEREERDEEEERAEREEQEREEEGWDTDTRTDRMRDTQRYGQQTPRRSRLEEDNPRISTLEYNNERRREREEHRRRSQTDR